MYDQFSYERHWANEQIKKQEEERIKEFVEYLKTKYNISVLEKMSYNEILALFLREKALDPDTSAEEVIGIDRADSFEGTIWGAVTSAFSNFADIFVPDIVTVATEGMSPLIGTIYQVASFLGQEIVDIGKRVVDYSSSNINYDKLLDQDSGFRLFSEYKKIYSMLPNSFRDQYYQLASQNSMLMAMSQNPEEANLARVYWDSFSENIKNIMASDKNDYLQLRYKDFQKDSWWITSDFLNKIYKMKDDFYPSMTRYFSGIAGGMIDPSFFLKYFNDVDLNSNLRFSVPNKTNSGKTNKTSSYDQPFELFPPLNIEIEVKGIPSYVSTGDEIATDFISPEELGHIPTKEELEKLKELQQIPIMIDNSAEGMSKIKSNTKDANDNAFVFSHTLSDIARYAGQIGGAFMNVNEEIGKGVMSAGTLTEGVAGIFKAFEGDKVNGLGLMSGIQGGFAGLQGLFGGEPGSDMSQLLGGMGGVGARVDMIKNGAQDTLYLRALPV